MDVLDIVDPQKLAHNFLVWVQKTYTNDLFENEDYTVLNIYTKVDYNFHETLPIEFQTLDIEYNFPDVIMTEGNNYYPGVEDYNEKIEYFTLRIKK